MFRCSSCYEITKVYRAFCYLSCEFRPISVYKPCCWTSIFQMHHLVDQSHISQVTKPRTLIYIHSSGFAKLIQSRALLSHRGRKLSLTRLLPSFKWITSSPDYLLYRWHLKYYLYYIIHQVKKKQKKNTTSAGKFLANSDAYSAIQQTMDGLLECLLIQ